MPAEMMGPVTQIFELGRVGYVAIGVGHQVYMQIAPGVDTETSQESNFFEELLVNPTVLELISRRGTLDCGGLEYVAIGYGHFIQLLIPLPNGHASLGVARDAPVQQLAEQAIAILAKSPAVPS